MRTLLLLAGLLLVAASARAEWPDLNAAPRSKDGARDAALVVGIQDYAHVADVPGAEANARAWHAWFKARGTRHVRVLLDADAWHGYDRSGQPRGLLAELDRVAQQVRPGGTLWFVFIGHGAPNGDRAQPDGLLLAHDVRASPDGIRADGIPLDAEVLPRLGLAARNKARAVAIIDACFSGRDGADRPLAGDLQPVFVVNAGGVPAGVTLLTAAANDQYAGALPGLGRPAFSYLTLGALRGWADADGDGAVTGAEARQYVHDALFEVVRGRRQTPQAGGELDRPLARGRERPPELKAVATPKPAQPMRRAGFAEGLGRLSALPAAPDDAPPAPAPVDLATVDTVLLDRLQAAHRAEARADAPLLDRAKAWDEVAGYAKAPAATRSEAEARAARWRALDEARKRRTAQVKATFERYQADRAKLAKLQGYDESVVSAAQKQAYAQEFETAYAPWRDAFASEGLLGPLLDWVRLPGGTYQMGSEDGADDEKPVRRVHVEPFALSRTEVTVGQYRACVRAAACREPGSDGHCNWGKSGREDHPVNCVSWDDAATFARWVGGRLPSETEWEYAARSGGHDQAYPWGDEQADCGRAVMDDGSGKGCGEGDTTFPVCSKPSGNTAQGLCDMAGNVWEWVADWYGPYGEAPSDGSARTEPARYRVIRGGSWNFTARLLRAADRGGFSPGDRDDDLGFRVARATP